MNDSKPRRTFARHLAARSLAGAGRGLERVLDGLGDARRTLNFLRGRLEFCGRHDDIYVVTYPRSGTTWMQYMLHLLLRGPDSEFTHLNEVSPWFERSLAIGSLTADDLDGFASPRLFKSHLRREWLPKAGRFIYVERDGKDVAVSYYHLYRRYLGFTGNFTEFFAQFLDGRVQYHSWFDHVGSWHRHVDDPNVLVVRYEDLLDDRPTQLRRVAEHCGLAVDDDQLARVLESSSFEAMKAIESRFDHATALLLERGVQPRGFLRRGEPGQGQATLSAEQLAAFEQRCQHKSSRAGRWDIAAYLH